MKYLPIMDELFASDSIIFLLIGLVVSAIIGIILKSDKKLIVGIISSIFVYALCELISNIPSTFLFEIIALFIGTISIGSFLGFLIALIVSKIKKKK